MAEWKKDKPVKKNVNTVIIKTWERPGKHMRKVPVLREKIIDFEWSGAD